MKSIKFIEKQNPNVLFDKYVVMPNHIHAIIVLKKDHLGRGGTLPLHRYIGQLKSFTNKRYNEINSTDGLVLWQENY